MDSESVTVKRQKFYSPLRYPGGKAGLSSFFFDVLDDNEIYDCTYVEPYAGGAGAALTLLILERVNRIIINDLDRSIYSFWKAILQKTDEFVEKIIKTDVTIKEWEHQKKIYNEKRSSILNRGFATFFLNRTNRSGIIEARPIGGMEQKGKWKIDARFNKENLIERIERISLYKNRITLSNIDGIELMKKVYKKPSILVYIDPPYYQKGDTLYLNHYNSKNHVSLAKFLNKKSKFNWLLTYDNVPEIKALYPARDKVTFSLIDHANKTRKSKEILIKSDSLMVN